MRLRVVAALLVLVTAANAQINDGGLCLYAPAGFTVVEDSPSAAALAKLPESLRERATTTNFSFFAWAADAREGEFPANANAVLARGRLPVTDDLLAELGKEFEREFGAAGWKVEAKSWRLESLGDVTCGRLLLESQTPDARLRQLIWILPGAENYAIVTCSAASADFARYEAGFDGAARRTLGLVQWRTPGQRVLSAALVGGALGGIVVLIRRLAKKMSARARAARQSSEATAT